ncbi:DUF2125 domain-containing protein [uncultured Brevundimonas sp.]|uniref:DUF2125 domain-containing protein n=1 Tax=uncultured Brevundimonas sp. TaxID=213418 RepID=UPI0030ECD85B|tara:strand:+ start:84894 stop:85952 length:1059 start_codon:yes stop_codon:yes gene_type:complete
MTVTPPIRRHSRMGLYVPLLIALALLAAWTGWWFYLTHRIETGIESRAVEMRAAGWDIGHGRITTTGWPFRTRIAIAYPTVTAPDGHALSAPALVAEANTYNPDKWVIIAPDGLVLTRPDMGKVAVRGDALRLSVSHLEARFPDLRIQLDKPVFTPHPGAAPFPILRADQLQINARPHMADGTTEDATTGTVDVLFRLTEARARPGGVLDGLAVQKPVGGWIETTIEGADHLRGRAMIGDLGSWARAGGRFTAVRGELKAGVSTATFSSDTLTADTNGRLQGALALTADKPLPALAGLARSGVPGVDRVAATGAATATALTGETSAVSLPLVFRDGRTWLGPFAVAPAPKLF